ncbi:hypothetical protein [Providencia sp.]|uniref:hypothetical protein n=1 Tax=Providencia sp. TaxID=589 RepID=UPI000E8D7A5B|nr:hypothetical protein [Providencia sp.]HBO22802.1 hypothetical protein [Providencia sp.]
MKTYSFAPYGPGYNSSTVVVLGRITHFEGISFNGIRGTEIHLDTGITIRTGMNLCDVQKIVEGNQ